MSQRIVISYLVMSLTVGLMQSAAAARGLAIPTTDRPPTIDGRLSDEVWRQGRWHSGLQPVSGSDTANAPGQTRFQFAIDQTHLYFSARCKTDSNLSPPNDYDHRDDKSASKRESVELFVGASGTTDQYVHFIFGADGASFDAMRSQQGEVTEPTWDARFDHRVSVGKKAWTLEVAIPLADLRLSDTSRQPWPINVARNAGPKQRASMASVESTYHKPMRFSKVQLPERLISPYLWAMQVVQEPHAVSESDGQQIKTSVVYHNRTGEPRKISALAQFRSSMASRSIGRPVYQRTTIDARDKRELTFTLPRPTAAAGAIAFELALRQGDRQQLVRRDTRELGGELSPFRLIMEKPFYRNTIFSSQNLDKIRLQAKMNLSDPQAQGTPVSVTLSDADGHKAHQKTLTMRSSKQSIEVPATNLAPGDYTLTATARLNAQQTLTANAPLKVAEPAPHEWYLDQDLVLRHNGERVMPLAYFNGVNHADVLTQEGVNLFIEYNAPKLELDDVEQWLDRAAAQDAWVTFQPYAGAESGHPERKQKPLSDKFIKNLRRRINNVKDHPGLMAYYLSDEPSTHPVVERRLKRIYEICREEDPYHPCIILDYRFEGIRAYADQADIFMPDFYPGFVRGGRAKGRMNRIARSTEAVLREGNDRVAVWPVPQVFSWGVWGREGKRAPRFTELRNMFYQGITAGAKGLVAYTFKNRGAHPHLELGMRHLYPEFRELEPYILASDASLVESNQSDAFYVSSRKVDDRIAIFATYTGVEPKTFTIPLKGAARQVDLWHVKNEKRTVSGGATIRDHFDTFAAHVYLSDPGRSPGPTLDQVQQRIEREIASRKDPNNLIQATEGLKVEVSSNVSWGGRPDLIFRDGWWGRRPRNWIPKRSDTKREITFNFPGRVSASRLILHGSHLSVPRVHVSSQENKWQTVKTRPIRKGDKTVGLRFKADPFKRLRVSFPTDKDRPRVIEVRLYDDR
jgi:hypothetical protein